MFLPATLIAAAPLAAPTGRDTVPPSVSEARVSVRIVRATRVDPGRGSDDGSVLVRSGSVLINGSVAAAKLIEFQ